jgi:hypothetical protein
MGTSQCRRTPLDRQSVYVYSVRTVPRSQANARLPTGHDDRRIERRKAISRVVDGIETPTHVRCGAMHERAGDHGERRRRQARRDCAIKPPVLPGNPTTTLLLSRPCHNNHPSPCCFSAFLVGRGRGLADRTTDAFHLAGAAAILANAGRAAGPDAVGAFAVSGGAVSDRDTGPFRMARPAAVFLPSRAPIGHLDPFGRAVDHAERGASR